MELPVIALPPLLAQGVHHAVSTVVSHEPPGDDAIAHARSNATADLYRDILPLLDSGRPLLYTRMPDTMAVREADGGPTLYMFTAHALVALANYTLTRVGEVAVSPGQVGGCRSSTGRCLAGPRRLCPLSPRACGMVEW